MTDHPTIPCFDISGNVGKNLVFGHNAYGRWSSTNKWTKEQWEGFDGARVDAVKFLATVWVTMLIVEKLSWTKHAKRLRISNYAAFIKFNMPRIAQGLDIITFFT